MRKRFDKREKRAYNGITMKNARGEIDVKVRTANASLCEDEVRAIRARLDAGASTVKQEAEWHKVGRETIRRLWRRETWDWVESEISPARGEAAEADLASEADESARRLLEQIRKDGETNEQS